MPEHNYAGQCIVDGLLFRVDALPSALEDEHHRQNKLPIHGERENQSGDAILPAVRSLNVRGALTGDANGPARCPEGQRHLE